jgi:glutaminyl-peptide cyclotransferase
MANIEKQLRHEGLAFTGKDEHWLIEGESYDTKIYKGGIEDDHIPFMERGVEILHIIPVSPWMNLVT